MYINKDCKLTKSQIKKINGPNHATRQILKFGSKKSGGYVGRGGGTWVNPCNY